MEHSKSPPKCKIGGCGQKFNTKSELLKHKREAHKKVHKCAICDSKFGSAEAKRRHLQNLHNIPKRSETKPLGLTVEEAAPGHGMCLKAWATKHGPKRGIAFPKKKTETHVTGYGGTMLNAAQTEELQRRKAESKEPVEHLLKLNNNKYLYHAEWDGNVNHLGAFVNTPDRLPNKRQAAKGKINKLGNLVLRKDQELRHREEFLCAYGNGFKLG